MTGIREIFPNDAQDVSDEQWITTAGQGGYCGLTGDLWIERQSSFKLARYPIFGLISDGLRLNEQLDAIHRHHVAIWRAANGGQEFWRIYKDRVQRTSPRE